MVIFDSYVNLPEGILSIAPHGDVAIPLQHPGVAKLGTSSLSLPIGQLQVFACGDLWDIPSTCDVTTGNLWKITIF